MKRLAAVGSSASLIFLKISLISACCQKVPFRELVLFAIKDSYPTFDSSGIVTLHQNLSDGYCVWDPLNETTFFIQGHHPICSDIYNMSGTNNSP